MKVLFLSDNFPPEVNAPATRTYEHCRRWVAAGAEVTVITCAPNFPRGKLYPRYTNRLRAIETVDGIRVVRVWSYMAANAGVALRTLDYFSFAAGAVVAGLSEKADLIVATSPQFFTTWAGFALHVLKRRPWIFELRDIWPESIAAVGTAIPTVAYRFLEWVELFLYRSAARVVAVTPAFKRNLSDRGINPAKIEVVTNGADVELFRERPLNRALRQSLGIDGKYVVGYIGTMGMAHGLGAILAAAASIASEPFHFLFVGDGASKADLVAKAVSLRLPNVTFHETVPKESVADWLAACDAMLIPLRRADTFRTVIPSKIFEAAAMARPILLGVDGQARELVDAFGAGVYFEPENGEQLVAALRTLAGERALCERLAEGGRSLAQHYGRDRLAAQMLLILQEVAAGRAALPK